MGQLRDDRVPSSHILMYYDTNNNFTAWLCLPSLHLCGSVDLSHAVFSGMQQRSTVKYRARNEDCFAKWILTYGKTLKCHNFNSEV